ncbi:MAG TPA: hypothetical protein PL070_03380, partial [Flavobacteriales bacterium]|nr:hypothetical protein [Flavobacteriales bacterium]
MNEGPHITSEQLARYLSGEADAAERQAVEAWAAADAAHAAELEQLRVFWDLGANASAPEVDVEQAWHRVEARIAVAEDRGRVV